MPYRHGRYVPHRKKISKKRRAEIYERDNHTCQICGWRLGDPTPPPKSRKLRESRFPYRWTWLEIDHIVPVVAAGTNDPSNLRVLCIGCNSAKGAKT